MNHRLAHVLFALSLQHYTNIMRRILLVYMVYVGVYFVAFARCMRLRVYRRFRTRGAFVVGGACSSFDWAPWSLVAGWLRAVPGQPSCSAHLCWLHRAAMHRAAMLL